MMALKANTRKPGGTNESEKMLAYEMGKVPPQAIDLEEAVLGAIMLERDAVITVMDILKPESFYKEAHQKIFQPSIILRTNRCLIKWKNLLKARMPNILSAWLLQAAILQRCQLL